MPTVRSNFSRYVIPDNLDPEGICCISVPIPNDRQWRAAFMGALWRLSLQTNWERDDDHRAKVIAARWRQIWSEVGNDMGICAPSDNIMRVTINASLRMQLLIEFTANGLDGIAPDRPDTFWDEDSGDAGDEIQQRSNALCNACVDYVNTIADDLSAKIIAASIAGMPIITPIAMSIAPVAGALFIGALSALEFFTVQAINDPDIRALVACCMYENLQGVAITEANFNASLTGCGFAALSDEEIVRDMLEAGVNDRENYLAFVNVLGSFMASVGVLEVDCVCGTWEHTFDFELDDQGWTNRAEDSRPYGVYSAGVGWVSVFTAGATPLAEKLYMQIQDFDTRVVLRVEARYSTTGSAIPSSSVVIQITLDNVPQDTEIDTNLDVPGEIVLVWNGVESFNEIEMVMVSANASDNSEYILKKVVVTGRGVDPF